MRPRTILVLALALICGGSAAVGVSQFGAQHKAAARQETTVLVVAADVPRGITLTAEDVNVQDWPTEMVPAGALTEPEDAANRTALVPLVKGEILFASKLADRDAGVGLAAMIPLGMRAFTILTPHVAAGVGGFLMPGNKVDVLLTTSITGRDDPTGGAATTTLLQNVQVLAVDKRLDASEAEAEDVRQLRCVTLLVTPDQAAKLDLGMNKGILHLALRNPRDEEEARSLPATMAQLRFYQERPRGPATIVSKADPVLAADANKPSEPEQDTSSPPQYSQIRTLRGFHRGNILVEQAY